MARLPDFSLTATDGSAVTPADLRGRPHLLYLTRHLGCTVCQARLRTLLDAREEIAARGAGLVVVLAADPERARAWQRREGALDVIVLADPARTLTRALRTGRTGPSGARHRVGRAAGLRGLLRGRGGRAGDEAAALGADVVLDVDARPTFVHRPTSAGDRSSPATLLAELDGLREPAVRA